MATPALRTKDIPGWKSKIAAEKQKRDDDSKFKAKKFSKLTAEEKDTLLQLVALRLGLVKPE